MSNDAGRNIDTKRIVELMERFQRASSATMADRGVKDQLLDELQDAVGLSGRMVTEQEVIRRAEKLVQGR
jgi:hypothetical protein